ncbi:MAG TPA: cupredoxin domain-containing protein [Rhodopila sp.]|nr:cupredoxin domain-containing protein [Rhodopila sp.]
MIALSAATPFILSATGARAAEPSFSRTGQHLTRSELIVPANTKVRVVVKNADSTPAAFESDDFKAERLSRRITK